MKKLLILVVLGISVMTGCSDAKSVSNDEEETFVRETTKVEEETVEKDTEVDPETEVVPETETAKLAETEEVGESVVEDDPVSIDDMPWGIDFSKHTEPKVVGAWITHTDPVTDETYWGHWIKLDDGNCVSDNEVFLWDKEQIFSFDTPYYFWLNVSNGSINDSYDMEGHYWSSDVVGPFGGFSQEDKQYYEEHLDELVEIYQKAMQKMEEYKSKYNTETYMNNLLAQGYMLYDEYQYVTIDYYDVYYKKVTSNGNVDKYIFVLMGDMQDMCGMCDYAVAQLSVTKNFDVVTGYDDIDQFEVTQDWVCWGTAQSSASQAIDRLPNALKDVVNEEIQLQIKNQLKELYR